MPGLVFGRLFDIGYLRLPVSLASGLLITCTFLTAECTEFWQLLLCQGFGIGVSPSVLTIPSSTFVLMTAVDMQRDRLQRRRWYDSALVRQEARVGARRNGDGLQRRRDDLPHHIEEPHRTPEVRQC